MPVKRIERSAIDRIMIRGTNWVGDAVMTLPAVEAVRRVFPQSRITVVAKPWVLPLYEGHPAVDDVMVYERVDGFIPGLIGMKRIAFNIRKKSFNLALLFQNAFEAALIAFMGGVTYRIGYSTDCRGFLLTHPVEKKRQLLKIHQVEYYLNILRASGWDAETTEPRLYLSEEDKKRGGELLGRHGISEDDYIVGVSPGAIYGWAKRWPAERFSQIGDRACERWGAKAVVFGTAKEVSICDRVCGSMTNDAVNLCAKTSLKEAMGVIGKCDFFVTNDSGLMHIAAALGVPTVAIFGPTDTVTTSPRGPMTKIVTHNAKCAPCLKKECPTDHHCMLLITPEEVWETMEGLRRQCDGN